MELCGLDIVTAVSILTAAVAAGASLGYALMRKKLPEYRAAIDLLDDALKNDGRIDVVEAAHLVAAAKKLL